MDSKKRFVMLWILLAIVLFFFFMKMDNSMSDINYEPKCSNCHYYDYTELINNRFPDFYLLKQINAQNIVVTYSRFMSVNGQVTLSFNYKNPKNGKLERVYGKATGFNANSINWSVFNDLKIDLVNNRVIVYTNEVFNSNDLIFVWGIINQALGDAISKIR